MVPQHDQQTGYLPPGVHRGTWQEMVERFGGNAKREQLLEGLLRALHALRDAGCATAYIDGSFVTTKVIPGDFDGCWDIGGVDRMRLDPVLMTFAEGRRAQKEKYGGEMFPAQAGADQFGTAFLEFFQADKAGHKKGIVMLDLNELP